MKQLKLMMNKEEVWKDIEMEGIIKGRYSVSNHGRVYCKKNDKYLKWYDNGAGYKTVPLRGDDETDPRDFKVRYVHRVVAIHFLSNEENKPTVNHKDYNKENNHVDNLEWATYKEQTADGMLNNRINSKKRGATKRLSKENIFEIAKLHLEGYGVNEIAVKLDFPRTTISSVFNGRSNWELFQFALEEAEQSRSLKIPAFLPEKSSKIMLDRWIPIL